MPVFNSPSFSPSFLKYHILVTDVHDILEHCTLSKLSKIIVNIKNEDRTEHQKLPLN